MKRLLITGATGQLGSVCRARLSHLADTIRLSSRREISELAPHEEAVIGDLSDKAAVAEMVEGCDGIVHMGGQPTEAPWRVVCDANIEGIVNVYEAARRFDCRRIFYASSNHTVGYHSPTDRLDGNSHTRPDTYYGVSKVFGEALASLYYDKFGIETASVRIGSCFPEPRNHRMLSTWLSFDDLIRLIECVFRVPNLGCPVIYGVSNNDGAWWNNDHVSYLGWKPQDNAEAYREKIEAELSPPDTNAPDAIFQGGGFINMNFHNEE